MKTLIFITLTVLELALIPLAILIPYKIGCLMGYPLDYCPSEESVWEVYVVGLLTVCVLILAGIIIWLIAISIPSWLQANRKLTEKIYNKIKR